MKDLSEETKDTIKQSFNSLIQGYLTKDKKAFREALIQHLHTLDPTATFEESIAKASHAESEEDSSGRMG